MSSGSWAGGGHPEQGDPWSPVRVPSESLASGTGVETGLGTPAGGRWDVFDLVMEPAGIQADSPQEGKTHLPGLSS